MAIDQAPIKSPLFNGAPESVINSVPWLQWFQKVLGTGGSSGSVTATTATTDKVRIVLTAPQSISASGTAKIQLNSAEFDTNSIWDSTNFRITPKKEGYYQFNYSVTSDGFPTRLMAALIKSGSYQVWGTYVDQGARTSGGGCLLYMNGTSDYVELYASHSTSSAINIGGTSPVGSSTFLSAVGPL